MGIFSLGFYFFYFSPKIQNDSPGRRGLGKKNQLFIKTDNFREALPLYGVFAISSSLILGCMIYWKSTQIDLGIEWSSVLLKFVCYLLSATIQDLVFFSLLLLRLRVLVNANMSSQEELARQFAAVLLLAVAVGFSHYPNWPLAFFSSVFAFCIGWIFYTHPNLFLVVIMHAFFGTMLHRIYQLHMKFGIFYANYDSQAHFFRKLIPGLEMLIGSRW